MKHWRKLNFLNKFCIISLLIYCITLSVVFSQNENIVEPYDKFILNPPIIEHSLCHAFVVVPSRVDFAVEALKAKGCQNITVMQSELSEAHLIVFGSRIDEIGLTF